MRHEERANKLCIKMLQRAGWQSLFRFAVVLPIVIVPLAMYGIAKGLTYISDKIETFKPLVKVAVWVAEPERISRARLLKHASFVRKMKRLRGRNQ